MATKNLEPKKYSPRDIGVALNNALVAASRPEESEILLSRLRRLSEYAQAVVQPCSEHMDEKLLTREELVVVLLSAALIVQASDNPQLEKLPLVSLAKITTKGHK